jgi:hypothetical protein
VSRLLAAGVDPETVNSDGETPLFVAVAFNRGETVSRLLAADVSVDRPNKDRVSPLQLACKLGFADVAAQLIDHGADVTAADNQRMTALHHATVRKDAQLVSLLLARGAQPLARNAAGKSPFSLANAEIAELLRRAIADLGKSRPREAAPEAEAVSATDEEEEEEEVEQEGVVAEHEREPPTPPRSRSASSRGEKVRLEGRPKVEFDTLRKEVQDELAEIRADFGAKMKQLTAVVVDIRRSVIAKKRKAAEEPGE